jgi:hypothetical protein
MREIATKGGWSVNVQGKNAAMRLMLERFKAESNQQPASVFDVLRSFVGVLRMLVGA